MSASLLKTKLSVPPLRAGLVSRPRLIARLDEGLAERCQLALISAPAGYGKTTLLGEWIAARDLRPRVAWVSLDAEENDPARFWAYVSAALESVQGDLEGISEAVFQSAQPPPIQAVLTGLLNQVAEAADPLVLVLDDYHAIAAAAIHDALAFVIENAPPPLHVVIATRVDPPLPVPRLRGRGQLVELYEADLRFTLTEAAEFLNAVAGLDLAAEDVAVLEGRTEGWIAGLQMAAISMRGRDDLPAFVRAFAGSHRYILDYLAEEVLRREPAEVQAFLLQTAILDRLCGPLCDAVVGAGGPAAAGRLAGAQGVLEYLERSNLFLVPLDDERRWYRYHRLFADLLRQRLQRETPARVPELHRRASAWYEQQGQAAEAVSHALAAADFERAARLIEAHGWSTFTRGEMTTVLGWIAALPAEALRAHPQLVLLHAWVAAKSGRLVRVEACLDELDPDRFPGDVAALRAYVAGVRGDLDQADALAGRALEHLPPDRLLLRAIVAQNLGVAHHWNGSPAAAIRMLTQAAALSREAGQAFQTLTAMAILGRAQEMQGALHEAAGTYRAALALAVGAGKRPVPFAGMAHVGLAGPLYEWNDLQGAVDHAREGIRLSALGGFLPYQVFGYARLAQAYAAQGDREGALRALEHAERLGQGSDYALVMALVAALRARLWLAEGDAQAALQWAQACMRRSGAGFDAAREIEAIAAARVLVVQGRIEPAQPWLADLFDVAQGAGRTDSAIQIMALQALALQAEGKTDQALSALVGALALGEQGGYTRTWLDEGAPMAGLLRQALSRDVAANDAARLLAAFGQEAEPAAPAMATLVEPLSERELQVLRLIAAGLSNSEIAAELVIAVSTVKSHINNIYGKLGVERRTQAVAKAQELGLV